MALPLKAVALRWPGPVTRRTTIAALVQKSPMAACLSTGRTICTAQVSLRRQLSLKRTMQSNQQSLASVSRTFTNARSNLAAAPQRYSTQTSTTSSSSSTTSTSGSASSIPLTWNTFFSLRTKRRRIQLAFSVITSLTGGFSGAVFLSTGMAESLVSQVPLDPFVTLGLMTFACAGFGWLIGPSIGSSVFYLLNGRVKSQIQQKEAEFLARVRKNRVDPTNSSAGNPVPDFYGEKISSVAGYRRWLKDQRAFNRKKNAAFV